MPRDRRLWADGQLPPRQARVLAAYRERLAATGRAPTVRDLARDLGRSHTTVHEQLSALVRRGRLVHDAGARPAYRLALRVEEVCPGCGEGGALVPLAETAALLREVSELARGRSLVRPDEPGEAAP